MTRADSVPLGVGVHVSDVAVDVLIGAGYENVRTPGEKFFEDAADLFGGLALAEDHFGKALTPRAAVVDASVPDVFVREILDLLGGSRLIDLTVAMSPKYCL
jgi:hypothetical protein